MSIQTTINYDVPANFSYDAGLIDVTSAAVLKILSNPSQHFIQNYSTKVGFTYDAAKAEFVGGLLRQKDQRPANATLGAQFAANLNANWGNGLLAGTSISGAVIVNNMLNCAGFGPYLTFSGLANADSAQLGTFRFGYTPNYNVSPAQSAVLFCVEQSAFQANNKIALYHLANGHLNLLIIDHTGSQIVNADLGIWVAALGIRAEFELNYNLTAGQTQLFINGVQQGATQAGTGTRTIIGALAIGGDFFGVTCNGSFDNFLVFSAVQHTSNYTPGYVVPENIYAASLVQLPGLNYVGAGNILSYDNFTTIEFNVPRYTVGGLWFNGSWVVSDGTYAHANTAAQVLVNLATLPLVDSVFIDVLFSAQNVQQSVQNLDLQYTGQTYSMNDPIITWASPIAIDKVLSIAENVSKSGSDNIRYLWNVGGIDTWWNGTTWVASNATLAQSNTMADLIANASSLLPNAGNNLNLKAILHSASGVTTPTLTSIVLTYNMYVFPQAEIPECNVWLNIDDILQNIPDYTSLAATLTATPTIPFYHSGKMFLGETVSAPVDANGIGELNIIETASIQATIDFTLNYTGLDGKPKVLNFNSCIIPNLSSVNLINIASLNI